MSDYTIEELELELLIQAIKKRYGYIFDNYARASLFRRVTLFQEKQNLKSLSELTGHILRDSSLFNKLLYTISVTASEMFRDPSVFKTLRNKVIPILRTYPHIHIWHAGCGRGEEVYSLAIILKEEGIYDRCRIYATDLNDEALESAQKGIYSLKFLEEYHKQYLDSGGRGKLSDYYCIDSEYGIMDENLRENILFSNHNMATDSVFVESQLIVCRNAMIYFNQELQDRVLSLFAESLVSGGILCIGKKETIQFSTAQRLFKEVSYDDRIYQRLAAHNVSL